MTNDLINGLFELGGAAAVALSIAAVWKDRMYAGLSVWQVVFFQSWGWWNVFYYPSIDQTWSFYGGLALAFSNTAYLFSLWRFRHVRLKSESVELRNRGSQRTSQEVYEEAVYRSPGG